MQENTILDLSSKNNNMIIDFTNIFSISYLFNPNPGPLLDSIFTVLVPFFVALLVVAYVARHLMQKNTYAPVKKFFKKISHFCLTFSVLGLLYIFFRQQSVYFLSAPAWLLVYSVGAILWGISILKYYFTDRPEQMEKIKHDHEQKKYLPS